MEFPDNISGGLETVRGEMSLETAHVLFMDIVGYSKLLIDQQRDQLNQLQRIVLATEECGRTNQQNLIRLPTGDGMALVFFGDPEAPLRCAAEISRSLKNVPDLALRMGVHSGLVYRMADINTNMNVAGGGINIAQRVMDCGDAGHILVSKRVADDLGQLARWSNCLHDLGIVEVKHGLKLHVSNFYGDGFGKAETPAKLRRKVTRPAYAKASVLAASLLVVGLIAVGVWYAARTRINVAPEPAGPEIGAPVNPPQSLTYSLTVQKMLNGKPLGDPIESAGDISFGNGWKFRFNVRPLQSGALYLINAGPAAKGTEYNVLFPLPQDGRLDPRLEAGQTMQAGWYVFGNQTGLEKLWIIWSTDTVAELDAIVSDAVGNKTTPGVIASVDQIATIESYLKGYASAPPEVTVDKIQKRTLVKGSGKFFVALVELSHEAY